MGIVKSRLEFVTKLRSVKEAFSGTDLIEKKEKELSLSNNFRNEKGEVEIKIIFPLSILPGKY